MCLAIPMQVIEINDYTASCEARGSSRDVSLLLIQYEKIKVGDYVMVHLGRAISKVTADEAKLAWELYDEMLMLESAPSK